MFEQYLYSMYDILFSKTPLSEGSYVLMDYNIQNNDQLELSRNKCLGPKMNRKVKLAYILYLRCNLQVACTLSYNSALVVLPMNLTSTYAFLLSSTCSSESCWS